MTLTLVLQNFKFFTPTEFQRCCFHFPQQDNSLFCLLMHYCSTVNGFEIFEEPDFIALWQRTFLHKKITKIDYCFIVVN